MLDLPLEGALRRAQVEVHETTLVTNVEKDDTYFAGADTPEPVTESVPTPGNYWSVCASRSKIGRRRAAVCFNSSGSTRVLPMTEMKLVSPVHRGTR